MRRYRLNRRDFVFAFHCATAFISGVINPLGALVTYLAQRALKDPLSRAFSFEYAITGAWADPKVVRVQNAARVQAQEQGQESSPPVPGAPLARPGG